MKNIRLLLLPYPVSYTHLDVYKRQVLRGEVTHPTRNNPFYSEQYKSRSEVYKYS